MGETGKVFGIGLSRTGTTSLTQALRILGLSAVHFPVALAQIRDFDAATDITVCDAFERLDALFPDSKFIYTHREKSEWLESCRKHWQRDRSRSSAIPLFRTVRKNLYGSVQFDRARFSHALDRYQARVDRYFRERPGDLLKLDIFACDDVWNEICPFLNRPVPDVPFPHTNRSHALDSLLLKLMAHVGDVGEVAASTGIAEGYLADLAGRSTESLSTRPIEADLGYEFAVVLRNVCERYPRTVVANQVLQVSEERLTRILEQSELMANLRSRKTGHRAPGHKPATERILGNVGKPDS